VPRPVRRARLAMAKTRLSGRRRGNGLLSAHRARPAKPVARSGPQAEDNPSQDPHDVPSTAAADLASRTGSGLWDVPCPRRRGSLAGNDAAPISAAVTPGFGLTTSMGTSLTASSADRTAPRGDRWSELAVGAVLILAPSGSGAPSLPRGARSDHGPPCPLSGNAGLIDQRGRLRQG
jgi:hypothetical protein